MFSLIIWLSFAGATRCTAFVPSSTLSSLHGAHDLLLLNVATDDSADTITGENVIREVFPGVHLPKDNVPLALNNDGVEAKTKKFVFKAAPLLFALNGKPKADGLLPLQNAYLEETLDDYTIPDDPNYDFFPNNCNAKTLRYLLKVDPFFASALTKTRWGFELRSFDRRDPDCKNKPSLYREMTRTLTGVGRNVNFFFDKRMKLTGYKVYDDSKGSKIFEFKSQQDEDYWASAAIYNLFFYASSIHATIHVLHYLITSAFQYVSKDFEPMHQWAKFYANNIQQKYSQVGTLLILPAPEILDTDQSKITALITGKLGFGSTAAITPILSRLLNTWGQNPSASSWIDSMVGISSKDMDRAGILTEFRKHVNLISPFAKEASDAFRNINPEKAAAVEERLKQYLKECGSFTSEINSLEDWIELMSITADVHGSTLGYTRLATSSDVMRWRDIRDPNWDSLGLNMITVLLGTVCGMEEGRHTMTSTVDAPYDPALQAVLDKYDEKATRLKEEYQENIQKDPDFSDYGWILSGFCTDGFDGKQLTSATYI